MTKHRILVIDDDRTILSMLEMALTKAEYNVVAARDGRSGLAKFQEDKPDLVVVDISMPGIDGYQVIEMIRQEDSEKVKQTPIIILTAHDQAVMRDYAGELDVDLYLNKPILPRNLVAHIKTLLEPNSKS
ncbi:MAG: response regulator [Chloroflexi bacterium]|nr:response regulator [Chloroflexota bacterium]